MPRKLDERVRAAVQEAINSMVANDPKIGAVKMRARLEAMVAKGGWPGPLPSERTIGQMIIAARRLTDAEKLSFQEVRWPYSFEDETLPWEMTEAYFDVRRPIAWPTLQPDVTVADVTWQWRVNRAAPDAPFLVRRTLALLLAHATTFFEELLPENGGRRLYPNVRVAVEEYIVLRGWLQDPRTYFQYCLENERLAIWITSSGFPIGLGWPINIDRAVAALEKFEGGRYDTKG